MEANNPRTLKAFGLNVRRLREAAKLTQEKAGEKAALDSTYISGIERGVRNPSLISICRLAKALGVSASELCNGVK